MVPFKPDVKLADLALGESDEGYVGEAHPFEKSGGILLVPANTIERLGIYEIEATLLASCMRSWIPGRISLAPDIARSP